MRSEGHGHLREFVSQGIFFANTSTRCFLFCFAYNVDRLAMYFSLNNGPFTVRKPLATSRNPLLLEVVVRMMLEGLVLDRFTQNKTEAVICHWQHGGQKGPEKTLSKRSNTDRQSLFAKQNAWWVPMFNLFATSLNITCQITVTCDKRKMLLKSNLFETFQANSSPQVMFCDVVKR